MSEFTVTELAVRLGVTRRRALDLLATGAIAGRRLANGIWLADTDSVNRFETTTRRGSGRTLDAATAWGLLWELSGLQPHWLPERTHARVMARIRQSGATALAAAVAPRTKEHRYRAADSARAGQDLIATGRAVASLLGSDLMDDRRRVSGYVRHGSVDDYAASHFMVVDNAGQDAVYDNTLPIAFDSDTMPVAVIAADLARSMDTRERAAGIRTLDRLRQTWLAAH